MANFSFLNDKPEYADFAKNCIDAEEGFKTSPNACIKLVRTAMEAAVKWLYKKDKSFVRVNHSQTNEKESFLALTSTPTFQKALGKDLTKKVHFCRKAGNQAVHNEREFSNDDALKSLICLFDFVQWIDKRYGKNYTARTFAPEEVPAEDSALIKFLKSVALVGGGIILKTLFDKFSNDKS